MGHSFETVGGMEMMVDFVLGFFLVIEDELKSELVL